MGLRFYHRFRLAPGLTLNLSKRGASVSAGMRGAHVTVGMHGTRETIGLPGTGVFLTEHQGRASRARQAAKPATVGLGGLLVLGLAIYWLARALGLAD